MALHSEHKKPDLGALKIDPSLRPQAQTLKPAVVIAAALILLGAGSGLVALLHNPSVEVETAVVGQFQPGQGLTVLNASGYVTPRRRATVAAKITGQVMETLVEEGMAVETGQVLARLDEADADARLKAARADREVAQARIRELEVSLQDAETDRARMRILFAKKVASQEDLDKASLTVDRVRAQLSSVREEILAADARVRMAQQDLANCTIRAPFAGVVVSKDAQIGEMVSPISAGGGYTRTGIATIVDMGSLEIEVDVNESHIASITPDQKVIATLDAYPRWQIPASVLTLVPTADRQKATVKVRIAFDELDPRILPDMGVKVAFKTGSEPEYSSRTALVPRSALRRLDGKACMFVCRNDVLERRAVTTGRAVGDTVQILAGVVPGTKFLVSLPASYHAI